MKIGIADIKAILDAYDGCQLECDGLTRVLHTLLANMDITHYVKLGYVTHVPTGHCMYPHYWIECFGHIIDYRCNMWFPDCDNVPHGVFADTQSMKYEGKIIKMPVLDDSLFEILTR